MKTRQMFTTCLLLFMSITATAQEKQNDATWEETINFISKNLNYINEGEVYDCNYKSRRMWYVTDISISQSKLIIELRVFKEDKHFQRFTVSLEKINEFKYGTIYTVGKNIDVEYFLLCDTGEIRAKNPNSGDSVNIKIDDNEMRSRIYKAFQHLAYLAKEKRKAKRKASGDKF